MKNTSVDNSATIYQTNQLANGLDFTTTGVENIVGWGIPDYTTEVSLTQNVEYTANTNCLLKATATSGSVSSNTHVSKVFQIDGIDVAMIYAFNYVNQTMFIPCPKGSTFMLRNSHTGNGSYTFSKYEFLGA